MRLLCRIYAIVVIVCFVTISHCRVVDIVEKRNETIGEVERQSGKLKSCLNKPKFRPKRGSFLTYMMRIKLCSLNTGMDLIGEVCGDRVFGFTQYYKLSYLKFCQPQKFMTQCAVNYSRSHDPDFIVDWWMARNNVTVAIATHNSTYVTPTPPADNHVYDERKDDVCREINYYFEALFQYYPINVNVTSDDARYVNVTSDDARYVNVTSDYDQPFATPNFTEWFLLYRPFCEPVACGTSRLEYNKNPLTSYHCFPPSCQPGIIFVIVFDSFLAVIVVVANVLVLAVAIRTPIMRNIPGYFKISLAVADLMVGAFVLPGSVYQNYVLYLSPLPFRMEGQRPKATDYFDQKYLNFMGIFTVLSFSMSIYTMGAASVDRYLAITKPFKYRQGAYLTTRRAIGVFSCIWVFGFVCAIYPVFTSKTYDVSALSLILATGLAATVVYVVTLGIPLIAVWVINGMMLRQVCADGKNRRDMSGRHQTVTGRLSTSQPGHANNNNTKAEKSRPEAEVKRDETLNRISKFARSVQSTFNHRGKFGRSVSSLSSQAHVERKLAKTLAVMIGAFTVALLPSIIVLALMSGLQLQMSPSSFPKTFSPLTMNIVTSVEYIAARMFLSNSFWNCIIYSVRNKHFRRSLVEAFICDEERKRERRRGVSMTTSRGGKRLRKTGSTDSGCLATTTTTEEKRKSTQMWEMSCVTRTDSNNSNSETKTIKTRL